MGSSRWHVSRMGIAFACVCGATIAATTADASVRSGPAVRGQRSLDYAVARNLVLTSFHNYDLSGKYFVSERGALRGGIGATFSTYETRPPRATSTESTTGDVRRDWSARMHYLMYPRPPATLNWFVGGGPALGRSRVSTTLTTTEFRGSVVYRKQKSVVEVLRWSGKLEGVIGVEWFIVEEVSLTAQYGMSLAIAVTTEKSSTTTEVDPRIKTPTTSGDEEKAVERRLSSDGVTIGVSIYF